MIRLKDIKDLFIFQFDVYKNNKKVINCYSNTFDDDILKYGDCTIDSIEIGGNKEILIFINE